MGTSLSFLCMVARFNARQPKEDQKHFYTSAFVWFNLIILIKVFFLFNMDFHCS